MAKKRESLFHGMLDNASKINNEISSSKIQMINRTEIVREEPFKSLLPFDDELFNNIKNSMNEYGFLEEKAIILWKNNGKNMLVEGNHRFVSAEQLSIEKIPCVFYDFGTADLAVSYALREQFKERRNITDQTIFHVLKNSNILDNKNIKNKAEYVSETFGISVRKAQSAINVVKYGTDEQHDQIKEGNTTFSSIEPDIENKTDKAKKISETKKKNNAEKKKNSPIVDSVPKGEPGDKSEANEWDRLEGEDDKKHTYRPDIDESVKITEIPDPIEAEEESSTFEGGFTQEEKDSILIFMNKCPNVDFFDAKGILNILEKIRVFAEGKD